jgi:hypothetical protein
MRTYRLATIHAPQGMQQAITTISLGLKDSAATGVCICLSASEALKKPARLWDFCSLIALLGFVYGRQADWLL